MVTTVTATPPAPKVFLVRVTDRTDEHKLVGYAFVQQTAFFRADQLDAQPEMRIMLQGFQQLFDKAGEYAFAAVPFAAHNDPHSGSMMIGANVDPDPDNG